MQIVSRKFRLRVDPIFPQGQQSERNATGRENHSTREEVTHRESPFLAWGHFHTRSRFARSTIPVEKWGTTRSLNTTSLLSSRAAILQILS